MYGTLGTRSTSGSMQLSCIRFVVSFLVIEDPYIKISNEHIIFFCK